METTILILVVIIFLLLSMYLQQKFETETWKERWELVFEEKQEYFDWYMEANEKFLALAEMVNKPVIYNRSLQERRQSIEKTQ